MNRERVKEGRRRNRREARRIRRWKRKRGRRKGGEMVLMEGKKRDNEE